MRRWLRGQDLDFVHFSWRRVSRPWGAGSDRRKVRSALGDDPLSFSQPPSSAASATTTASNQGFESLPLRQDAQSGHSFSEADQRSEPRRMRPFLANCPNHEDRLWDPFWAFFTLSRPTFSDATEPRPIWYGCRKLDTSMGWMVPEGGGFGKPPLRRSEPGSNCLVQRVRYSVVSDALPSAAGQRARVDPTRKSVTASAAALVSAMSPVTQVPRPAHPRP
jgi:hypothetical protein